MEPGVLIAVAQKLIGPIDPVGETHTDEVRFNNLRNHIALVDALLWEINVVATNKDRKEHSMQKAGKRAAEFLARIRESLST